jgi:N-methylhydantoinase B/oxoprolinase/acetone carboxylase alpha subunit
MVFLRCSDTIINSWNSQKHKRAIRKPKIACILKKEMIVLGRVKEMIEAYGLKKVISYLDSNPNENIPKVIDWIEKLDKDKEYATAYRLAREP